MATRSTGKEQSPEYPTRGAAPREETEPPLMDDQKSVLNIPTRRRKKRQMKEAHP